MSRNQLQAKAVDFGIDALGNDRLATSQTVDSWRVSGLTYRDELMTLID
jgi:hypothetical protein